MKEFVINFNGEIHVNAKNKKQAKEIVNKILDAAYNAYVPDTRSGYYFTKDDIHDLGKVGDINDLGEFN